MGGLAAGASLSALGSEASTRARAQTDGEPEAWPPADIWEAHVAVLSGSQADVETDAGGCANLMPGEEGTLMVDLVLEDIQCVTQAHIHEGERGEDGPVVAPLLRYTEEVDGSGDGDPLTTRPDAPLIEGTVVDDPELVDAILDDPESYYVNVHTVRNPGGEIRGQIRGFDFGQETELEPVPAEFTVSGLDPENVEVVRGEEIDVSARIRNVGDVTDTQTVELRIDDEVVAERELELACRSSRRVRFEDIDTDDLDPDEYEHGVFTEDDSETGTLTVLRPAEFRVSDLTPEDVTVTRGDQIDVSAQIRNVGDVTDTQTVEFRIDDETAAERKLELDGRESRRVRFEDIETEDLDPGEYEHGVFTEDDSETATLTVLSPPEFVVSNLDPVDVTVMRGDQIDVSARVRNVGEATGTQTVEFRIDGEAIDDRSLELDGEESETVRFEGIDTSGLEPGEYEHGVFTEDDSETGTLTVEAAQEAEFVVAELDPMERTLTQGEPFELSTTIENVGGARGTQTVALFLDDERINERNVTLESGGSRTFNVRIQTSELEPGEYSYDVVTENDEETGVLTVEPAQEAEFVVAELDPMEQTLTRGEVFQLSATIENVGGARGTQTVTLFLDDEPINERNVTLESGGSRTFDVRIQTSELEPGEYSYDVVTEDDEETGTLTIEGEEDEGDNGEEENGGEEDEGEENGDDENGEEENGEDGDGGDEESGENGDEEQNGDEEDDEDDEDGEGESGENGEGDNGDGEGGGEENGENAEEEGDGEEEESGSENENDGGSQSGDGEGNGD